MIEDKSTMIYKENNRFKTTGSPPLKPGVNSGAPGYYLSYWKSRIEEVCLINKFTLLKYSKFIVDNSTNSELELLKK